MPCWNSLYDSGCRLSGSSGSKATFHLSYSDNLPADEPSSLRTVPMYSSFSLPLSLGIILNLPGTFVKGEFYKVYFSNNSFAHASLICNSSYNNAKISSSDFPNLRLVFIIPSASPCLLILASLSKLFIYARPTSPSRFTAVTIR